jgi:hypothetical protein
MGNFVPEVWGLGRILGKCFSLEPFRRHADFADAEDEIILRNLRYLRAQKETPIKSTISKLATSYQTITNITNNQ